MSDSSIWNNRRVLVTGAGGFIGSHLAEQMVQLGARTRCLLRYNSQGSLGWLSTSPLRSDMEILHGDIRDKESVLRAVKDADVIFHLAALVGIPYSYESPRSYVQTNIEGTLNVLEAARQYGTERLICTSTSEVYGSALHVPIDENHALQGQSPYSATKIGADKIAESYHLSFGLPVSIARPFNTYGPRQSSRAVIPTIITQALAQTSVKLGNLHTTRDFNFVSDTVAGFLAIAESSATIGKTLNIGSGIEISIHELAELIFELTGTRCPVDVEEVRLRPEASEVDRLCANSLQLNALTGWKPRVSLREGLERTIEWIGQNLGAYSIGSYTV
ncbi:SDR family NAD(P)-dependent oxidoreductase [Granulicella mallensis]|uniref:dTDP-glucose 4,6-dehydratase n=1 Tax=Granulicella mallensis TaxID=940614 RepID=A0A7W7ZVB5_9BACT|nr:SDR family NAD(P)-dependent oxidoreductase [Granulicella mallensis]MBB5066462.1 dTDP-glucose 4,6-dehydratase [Granulicella mallensis]